MYLIRFTLEESYEPAAHGLTMDHVELDSDVRKRLVYKKPLPT